MAINWGGWEYSGGNGMRVGIDVTWENVTHGESAVTATVEYYTQNNYSWSDGQSLNLGGAIGGSISYHNGQGDGVVVKRGQRSYTYRYGSNEYGSSPGNRTFSATVNGAFNGITPSKSVSTKIPARPIAAPNDPGNVSVSRINDGNQKITWNNRDTSARPWNKVDIDRDPNGNWNWFNVGTQGGNSSSFTDSNTSSNMRYRYRVRAVNGAGTSSFQTTELIYTQPDAPRNASRQNGSGTSQIVTWTNKGGYSQFNTEVQRGVTPAGSSSTSWTTIASGIPQNDEQYIDSNADPTEATRYRVRHYTTDGVQGRLYSSWSNFTSETVGETTPPLAPIGLSPDSILVDPSIKQRLSWTFRPGMTGDSQTKFELQHRVAGSGTWTTVVRTTSDKFYDLPANKYNEDRIIEWQVRVWGLDPTASPYATPVSFQTAVVPVPEDPIKVPVEMDLFTGRLEANTNANELRDYVGRFQANMTGGGTRAVNASWGVSWSQRFISISLGRSDRTFPDGYHDIENPDGWNISNRQIVDAGGVPRATLTINTSDMKLRPGETVAVRNCGAPYDGDWIVRSISSNQVSFDLPTGTATEASQTASGGVFPLIKGHGDASDLVPTNATINLNAWDALYYEMPFGWGGGTIPKKNGVVNVTSFSRTSNVATIGIAGGHWFRYGDRVFIENVDPAYDGKVTITAVTPTSISYDNTGANQASVPVDSRRALARPTGTNTFYGNFHVVNYKSDFVVPSNWVLIALRNADLNAVEWAWGDAVDPGFDSDSPVFKQAIFTSTTDVTTTSGNTPPIRVGNITGAHLRMDGNEIVAMDNGWQQGILFLNGGGGQTRCNDLNITGKILGATTFDGGNNDFPNIPTGGWGANANLNPGTGNRLRRDTSSRKFKENEREVELDVEQILRLKPKTFQRNDHRDPVTDELVGYREDNPWYYGFIAEDARDEGLLNWVIWGVDDDVDGFAYDKWVVALQAVCQHQEKKIEALENDMDKLRKRLDKLEGK